MLTFKKVCDENPSNALEKLGELMNASQAGSRDLFECSHPDLDRLVETCRYFRCILMIVYCFSSLCFVVDFYIFKLKEMLVSIREATQKKQRMERLWKHPSLKFTKNCTDQLKMKQTT